MKKIPVRLFESSTRGGEYEFPEEADVLLWLKREGDYVEEGEGLCTLETDKATFVLPAPVSGTLLEIRYPMVSGKKTIWKRGASEVVGDTRFYNPSLCIIETEEVPVEREVPTATPASFLQKVPTKIPKISPLASRLIDENAISFEELLRFFAGTTRIEKAHVEEFLQQRAVVSLPSSVVPPQEFAPAASEKKKPPHAVPAARQRAKELNVDLAAASGTGPQGIILVADVERLVSAQEKQDIVISASTQDQVALAIPRIKRVTAKHVEEGARIPTSDTEIEFDFTDLVGFSKAYRDVCRYGLWFPVLAALVRVLSREEFILFNSYWDAANEERPLIVRRDVHMGISYDRGKQPRIDWEQQTLVEEGLRVLVVKNAGRRSLPEFLGEVYQLLAAAEQKKLSLPQVSGYSFIFNNIGALGHRRGRSILVGKIAAMLNLGRIDTKSSQGVLQIAFDHRIINGAMIAPFLRAVYQETVERVLPALRQYFDVTIAQ